MFKHRLSGKRKRIVAAAMAVCLIAAGSGDAYATTLDKAQAAKDEAQQNLDSVNGQISSIQSQQSALQSEINALDADLVTTIANISILEDEISEKEAELEQANSDLDDARVIEAEQYESMKERISYMYVNGGGMSFMEALLGSSSFAEALNRVEMASSVYETDRAMLQEYQETEEQIQELVYQIEDEQQALQDQQADLESEKDSLNSMIAEKSAEMDDFDSMLAQAMSLASQYKATIDEQTQIINEEVAAQQAAAALAEAESSESGNRQSSSDSSSSGSSGNSSSGSSSSGSSSSGSSSSSSSSSGSSSSGSSSSSSSSSTASGSGQAVANYACQFVGNPYVWGGTSLTNGCDCSGFIMSVYAHFGVSLPHSSYSLRYVGYAVSASDLQPGDIICYSGHCAIYIGGGAIVHASNSQPYPQGGIKITSNYAYTTVVAIRRIF